MIWPCTAKYRAGYFYIQSHLMTFRTGSLQNPVVRVDFTKKSPEIGQSA